MRWSWLGLKCFAVLHGIAHANETGPELDTGAFLSAVFNGAWSLAEEIAKSGSEEERNTMIARIDDLIMQSKAGARAVELAVQGDHVHRRIVSPAFQWAQNVSFVFIEAKYAHKMSAPARTSHVTQDVSIERTKLSFAASPPPDKAGDEPLFELNISLFKPLAANASTWASSSAGRITFTLAKETQGHWDELLAQGSSQPHNMGFWWDMQESLGDTGWMKSDASSAGRIGRKGSDVKTAVKQENKMEEHRDETEEIEKEPTTTTTSQNMEEDYEKRKKRFVKKSNKVLKEYKGKIKDVKSKAVALKKNITKQADQDKKAADAEMFKTTRSYREEADHMRFFADSPPDWIANYIPTWATYLLLKEPVWPVVLDIAKVQQLRRGRLGSANSKEVKDATTIRSQLKYKAMCTLGASIGGVLFAIYALFFFWSRQVASTKKSGLGSSLSGSLCGLILSLICLTVIGTASALVAVTGTVLKCMGEW